MPWASTVTCCSNNWVGPGTVPPDSGPDAESDLDLNADQLGDPAEPASDAFPNPGPVVWKDPRVCLLLPYWLAHLPQPVAAVFIWRSPLPVAHSLRARDRTHLADGVALWERYNRSGLAGLVGVDTFVTRYESIVEDPVGRLGDLAGWLAGLPQFAAPPLTGTWRPPLRAFPRGSSVSRPPIRICSSQNSSG